ncbi:MAG: hypothetical protein IKB56_03850, partial [Clostridia bacterium]|nr:hypothetical protein [Clostridia bacterium]
NVNDDDTVTGSNQSLKNYLHYYVALNGAALTAFKAGATLRVGYTVKYHSAAFVSGSGSKDARARMIASIVQGYTSGTTMNSATTAYKEGPWANAGNTSGYGKNDWKVQEGSLTGYVDLVNDASKIPGFTIQINSDQTCTDATTAEYWSYNGISEVSYYITWSGKTTNRTITFNSNGSNAGGSDETNSFVLKTSSSQEVSTTMPTCPWSYEGYEFDCWEYTSDSTTYTASVGTSVTHKASTTFKARWKPKNYPVISYDLYTDAFGNYHSLYPSPNENAEATANYAAEVRKAYYYKTGSVVIADKEGSGYTFGNITSGGTTYSNASRITQSSGGNRYNGFTAQGAWFIGDSIGYTFTNIDTPSTIQSSDWLISYTPSGVSSSIVTGALTHGGAVYIGFYWIMDAPSVSISVDENGVAEEVNYGTAIYLDEYTNPSHNADTQDENTTRGVIYSNTWKYATGNYVSFYVDGENVLYAVSESSIKKGSYLVITMATISITGTSTTPIELRTAVASSSVKFIINPIKLKMTPVKDAVFEYNGLEREFPFGVAVDETQYDADTLAGLQTVFDAEKNGSAWYYNENGNNSDTTWGKGVKAQLIGLDFVSALGYTNNNEGIKIGFYQQEGKTTFLHAGTYSVNAVELIALYGEEELDFHKTDFIWTNSLSDEEQQTSTAEGSIKATIEPAKLDIYSLYGRKTFGDLGKITINVIEGLNDEYIGQAITTGTAYIYVSGLLGNDFSTYKDALANAWRRGTINGEAEIAGVYPVYLDLFTDAGYNTALAGLLNDYGITVDSTSDTFGKPYLAGEEFVDANSNGVWDEGEEFTDANENGAWDANGRIVGGITFYRVTGYNPGEKADDTTDDLYSIENTVAMLPFYYIKKSANELYQIGENTLEFALAVPDYDYNNFEIIPIDVKFENILVDDNIVYNGVDERGVQIQFSGFDFAKEDATPDVATQIKGIVITPEMNWDNLSLDEKIALVDEIRGSGIGVVIMGTNENKSDINGLGIVDPFKQTGTNNNVYDYLYFRRKDAGSYKILLIDVTNPNYSFVGEVDSETGKKKGYIEISWVVKQKDVSIVETTAGSTTFGEVGYGGQKITFGGIISGDHVSFTVATTPGIENFRYYNLNTNTQVDSETEYFFYGKNVGTYSVTLSNLVQLSSELKDADSLYGSSYGCNYKIPSDIYKTDDWDIIKRSVSATDVKTVHVDGDGNVTEVENIPENMIYNYSVRKGITGVINDFFAENFITLDLAQFAVGDTPAYDVSDFVTSVLSTIEITSENGGVDINDDDKSSVVYSYLAYDAKDYNATINLASANHTFNESISFTIGAKNIDVVWTLNEVNEDDSLTPLNVFSKEYGENDKVHTCRLTYAFKVANAGEYFTTDNAVYVDDYDNGSITITRGGEKTVSLSAEGTLIASQVAETDSEGNEIYEAILNNIANGNYVINSSTKSKTWSITRKALT